jgi:hypothetical protein
MAQKASLYTLYRPQDPSLLYLVKMWRALPNVRRREELRASSINSYASSRYTPSTPAPKTRTNWSVAPHFSLLKAMQEGVGADVRDGSGFGVANLR